VIAISHGIAIFGMIGTVIFKENINRLHFLGWVFTLGGCVIYSLIDGNWHDHQNEQKVILAKTFKDDKVLLFESLLATFCFGTRIILAKYSSKVIGTFNFLKIGM
jgi:hypothetical protein